MEFLIKLSFREYKRGKTITVLIRSVVAFKLVVTADRMWPSVFIIQVPTTSVGVEDFAQSSQKAK